MKSKIFNLITRVTAIATIASSFYMVSPVKAVDLNFTNMQDEMTRLANGEYADHTISFKLPTAITFDVSDNTDVITVDFDAADFSYQASTYVVGDFTFDDGGGTMTIVSVTQGAGAQTANCAGASTDDIAVTFDQTAMSFGFTPCSGYAGSGAAADMVITIAGTAGNGLLQNASAGASQIALSMYDEGADTHSGDIYVYIVDDDQVTITADVNPSMTFDLDTSIATGAESSPTYSVSLGTLDSASIKTSADGTSGTINMIGVDLSSNATGGTLVTVRSATNNGLVSTSDGGDTIAAGSGAMSAGTAAYGICVHRVDSSSGTLAADAGFHSGALSTSGAPLVSSSCDYDSHTLGSTTLSTTAQTILTTSSTAIYQGRAEIMVKATVSVTTPAHDDYTDTLTFIATGTF